MLNFLINYLVIETDGIVLRHDYCGSIESASANCGRTLIEAGLVKLRHIWGDDDCGDDNIDDTPTGKEQTTGLRSIGMRQSLLVGACSSSPNKSLLNLLEKCL